MAENERRGGSRKGAGRPKGSPNRKPLSERKNLNLNITLTVAQLESIRAAARESGMSISAYVLSKLF